MNEEQARKILGDAIEGDNGLYSCGWYLAWSPHENTACLDGDFTAEDLEAIAWWMRNKSRSEILGGDDSLNPNLPPLCQPKKEPNE